MKAISEVIVREIAGEHLLIPVGSAARRLHGMIRLSESGLLLWRRLQTSCTETELVAALLAEYDVQRETAQADVRAFVEQMSGLGLLAPEGVRP